MTARGAVAQLCDSPILEREGQRRARSWRTPFTISAFVCLLGGFALLLFSLATSRAPAGPAAADMANVAFLTVALQLVVALLVVPARAGSAIAGERELRSLDLLLVGRLGPRHIVVTKLAASLAYLLLLLVAAAPVLLAAFLYAGLDVGQLARCEALTVVTVVTLGSVALLLSALIDRPTSAVLASYGAGLALFVGTVLLGLVVQLDPPQADPGLSPPVHPFVLANPFYAAHEIALGPLPGGTHLGQAGRLLTVRGGRASTWGPVVQPWLVSVGAQVAVAAGCLVAATWAVARRRRSR